MIRIFVEISSNFQFFVQHEKDAHRNLAPIDGRTSSQSLFWTLFVKKRISYEYVKTAGGKGKRERPLGEKGKGKRGTAGGKWEKRENGKGTRHDLSEFPPYNQSARTHARTETEIDFPVGLTPPNLRCENLTTLCQRSCSCKNKLSTQ